MGASRTWIAVNALLAAMLACNVPAVQRPVQPEEDDAEHARARTKARRA